MARYLIDAFDLGRNQKGITRVISCLLPQLTAQSSNKILVVTTAAGLPLLPGGNDPIVVTTGLQSEWEQWGLPRLARDLRVDAIYSHRECGPSWGPPIVLHIPEDPAVRWRRSPPRSARDRARKQ